MVEKRFKSVLPPLLLRAQECVRDRGRDRDRVLPDMSELLLNDRVPCVSAKYDHAVFLEIYSYELISADQTQTISPSRRLRRPLCARHGLCH